MILIKQCIRGHLIKIMFVFLRPAIGKEHSIINGLNEFL